MENIKVNPSELRVAIKSCLDANLPCLVVGAPGVGKSEIAVQAIKDWQANASIILEPGVSMLPTDTKGLGMASVDRTQADWLPYGMALELQKATGPTVLLIEDVGQAAQSVQASLMPVLQARQIGGQRISDNVRFVLTTNRREDKAGVQGLIEPLKNRCIILELVTSVDNWLRSYAIPAGLPVEIRSFYRAFPNHLQAFVPSSDVTNTPTARQASAVAKLYSTTLQAPKTVRLALFSGAIGQAAALDLIAFLDLWGQLPDPDAIIADPSHAPLPSSRIDLAYATISTLIQRTTIANFAAIMTYVNRINDVEMQAYYIDSACADPVDSNGNPQRDSRGEVLRNPCRSTQPYTAWILRNSWMYS